MYSREDSNSTQIGFKFAPLLTDVLARLADLCLVIEGERQISSFRRLVRLEIALFSRRGRMAVFRVL